MALQLVWTSRLGRVYAQHMVLTGDPPLYRQVADRLAIDLRRHPHAGYRLPSERQLCQQLGVSRVTLRAGLELLAREGVIASSPARGWFTAAKDDGPRPTVPPRPDSGRLTGFTEAAALVGQATSATVLEASTRACTLDEAELFGLVAGSEVFSLRRLRRLQGLVIAVDHSRVPLMLCPDIATHDFTSASLYDVLRRARPPVEPTLAEYAVEAVAPDDDQIALLDLSSGVPLLVATQRTFDEHGRVCELGRTEYRGDRFRFRATLGTR